MNLAFDDLTFPSSNRSYERTWCTWRFDYQSTLSMGCNRIHCMALIGMSGSKEHRLTDRSFFPLEHFLLLLLTYFSLSHCCYGPERREHGIQWTGKANACSQINIHRQMKLSNHIFVSHFLPPCVLYVMHSMYLCVSLPVTLIFAWKQTPNSFLLCKHNHRKIDSYYFYCTLIHFPSSPRFFDRRTSLFPTTGEEGLIIDCRMQGLEREHRKLREWSKEKVWTRNMKERLLSS